MLDEVKNNVLVKEANKLAKKNEKKRASKQQSEKTTDENAMVDETADVEKRPRRHKKRNTPY